MKFLSKIAVVRKKSGKEPKERVSFDLSLITSMQDNVLRDVFNISDKFFESLELDKHSVVFVDSPTALVVVTEGSKLATSFASKRETAKTKARSFASPELLSILRDAGVIPADTLPQFFKATFTLKEDETLLAETKEAASQHPDGDFSADIVKVVLITDPIIGSYTPRTKKEDEESGDEEVVADGEEAPKAKKSKTTVLQDETV